MPHAFWVLSSLSNENCVLWSTHWQSTGPFDRLCDFFFLIPTMESWKWRTKTNTECTLFCVLLSISVGSLTNVHSSTIHPKSIQSKFFFFFLIFRIIFLCFERTLLPWCPLTKPGSDVTGLVFPTTFSVSFNTSPQFQSHLRCCWKIYDNNNNNNDKNKTWVQTDHREALRGSACGEE